MSVICTECQPIYLAWMQFFFTTFLSAYSFEILSVHPGKNAFSTKKNVNPFLPNGIPKKSKLFIVHQWLFNIQKSITILIVFLSDTIFDGNFIWRHLEEEKKLPPCFCFSILLVWSWSFQTSVRKNWLLRFDLTKKRCCFSDKESNAFELISQKHFVKDDI